VVVIQNDVNKEPMTLEPRNEIAFVTSISALREDIYRQFDPF
jgi:hypothetical protein